MIKHVFWCFGWGLMAVKAFGASCEERVAIDVGSGTTKLIKAEVCDGKIAAGSRVAFRARVNYAKDIGEQKTRLPAGQSVNLSEKIRGQGIGEILGLAGQLATTTKLNAVIVATASFRDAANGSQVLTQYREALSNAKTSVNVLQAEVVSQEAEARLGLLAVMSDPSRQEKIEDLAVWDIGNGSSQLSYISKGKVFRRKRDFFRMEGTSIGANAAVEALSACRRARVKPPAPLWKGGDADPSVINGPVETYPLGAADHLCVVRRIASDVKMKISFKMRRELSKRFIFGIGGVIFHNTCSRMIAKAKGCLFDLRELELAARDYVGLDKERAHRLIKAREPEFDVTYADTAVLQMFLVEAYMKALDIRKVKTAEVEVGDGVLVDEKYWK